MKLNNDEYYILEDKHEEYPPYSSKCWFCIHFRNYECAAFPDGIPDEYLSNKAVHTNIDSNQIGDAVFTELI